MQLTALRAAAEAERLDCHDLLAMTAGRAFIFLFPYEIHVNAVCREPRQVSLSQGRTVVYVPFANGEGLRLHRDVSLATIPRHPGSRAPEATLPELHIPGSPGWADNFYLADGLRIDAFGFSDNQQAAENIARRFAEACRLWTRQWWIGRGASESLALLHAVFDINSVGQPIGTSLDGIRHIAPWLGTEILLDDRVFGICCEAARLDRRSPLSISNLFDSIWHSTHGNVGPAILNAAIACEGAFTEQAFRQVERGEVDRAVVRQAVNGNGHPLMYRLDHDAVLIFGQSFKVANGPAYERMNDLWNSRNALAHGNPAQVESTLADVPAACSYLIAALEFFEWLSSLTDRDALDPFLAVKFPLYRRIALDLDSSAAELKA